MNLNDALRILNLNENYTEDELRKAYRKLIIKYHPDKHPESKKEFAEKQTKIINEAKDILEKNLKNRTYNNQTNNNYNKNTNTRYSQNYYSDTTNKEYLEILKKFKKELEFELETIKKIKSNNPNDKLFHENIFYFTSILNEFSYKIIIAKDIYSIKKDYQNFRRKYNDALEKYYLDFNKTSGINTHIYTIQHYDTLNDVRNLMHDSIADILKLELVCFIDEPVFEEILPLLYSIKKKYILSCLYGYSEIEDIKTAFKNDIVNELKKYRKRKQLLSYLETNKSFVITNLKTIVNLRENILSEEKFYNIYSKINIFTKIKSKTRNLLKRK